MAPPPPSLAGRGAAVARAPAPGRQPPARRASPRPPRAVPPPSASEIEVRLELAASTGKLDLSDCGLSAVPAGVLRLADLEDLSLAGNDLESLPDELGELPLVRLQLAGNRLTSLPPSLGRLARLEGLWAHGNLLTSLPPTMSGLTSLRALSLAGNRLVALPASCGALCALEDASLAGNALASLPPDLAGLTSLRKLSLNGNALASLPEALGGLPALARLALQANPSLASLPATLGAAPALADLNAADCGLASLPEGLASAPRLARLTLYGNRLALLPPRLAAAPALTHLWLEGNPLTGDALAQLTVDAGRAGGGRRVGLDAAQAARAGPRLVAAAGPAVAVSRRAADGAGYWKLEPGARGGGEALVVAFGSAPGEPNWGRLLARLRADPTTPAASSFDVLHVVDGGRSWYDGGGDGAARWRAALAAAAAPYGAAVVLLGDSMGATAALQMADAVPPGATALAFCPQADLGTASIRPAASPAWRATLNARVAAAVAAAAEAGTAVRVHVGSWQHDVDQVAGLGGAGARVKVWDVPHHRLAAALDARGALLPLVRDAVLAARECGGRRGVRPGNVL